MESSRVEASLDISVLMSSMLRLNANISFNLFKFTMGTYQWSKNVFVKILFLIERFVRQHMIAHHM